APGAAVVGRAISDLSLPATTRVMAVFRGPALLSPLGTESLRAGDMVMLIGPRHDVRAVRTRFTEQQRASA
ncbi:MAG: TrkA C-terminal domain-containing protein, partial [Nitrospiraceae bacterium]